MKDAQNISKLFKAGFRIECMDQVNEMFNTRFCSKDTYKDVLNINIKYTCLVSTMKTRDPWALSVT